MFNTDDLVTSVGVGEPSNDDDPKLNTSTGSCDVGNLDESVCSSCTVTVHLLLYM